TGTSLRGVWTGLLRPAWRRALAAPAESAKFSGDLFPAEPGAVVALDQQRDLADLGRATRPVHGVVERTEFLKKLPIFVERVDRLRGAWTAIDPIPHGRTPS